MKNLTQYVNEYLIKKKLDKVHKNYNYEPNNRDELIDIIIEKFENNNYDLTDIDVSKFTTMRNVFDYVRTNCVFKEFDVTGWDVSNVEDMYCMFNNCTNITNIIGLDTWDVSNVKDMGFMFNNCYKFNGAGIENWNVSNVENMSNMFQDCKRLKADISNWDVSNVQYLSGMFVRCYDFKHDLSKWNVHSLKSVNQMFYHSGINEKSKNVPKWYYDNI